MNQMKKTGACPKCGSIKIAGPLKTRSGTHGSVYFMISDWRSVTLKHILVWIVDITSFSQMRREWKILESTMLIRNKM